MEPILGETIYLDFIISDATGAAADADAAPTCAVFEDATDVAIVTPTVTKRTSLTGNYRVPVAVTSGNGFEADKSYNVVVSATVGTVATKGVVGTFQLRASLPPTAVQNRTEMDSNSTQFATIVADTNELQTDWANGGRLDVLLNATAGDPLGNPVPGAYTAGTAGAALGAVAGIAAGTTRLPGDYPVDVRYRVSAPVGAIDRIIWATGKVWTYGYTAAGQLAQVSEA